jgi:uncharacterized membrane protein
MITALYVALTLVAHALHLDSGAVEFRISEALCILPFFIVEAVPGLYLGCLIANLLSPYGALDIIFGSLATLLAALWTRHTRHKWLAPLPPVICNALIIPAVIALQTTVPFTAAFWAAFGWNSFTIGLGELIACYALGGILLTRLPKIPALKRYFS